MAFPLLSNLSVFNSRQMSEKRHDGPRVLHTTTERFGTRYFQGLPVMHSCREPKKNN